MTDNEIIKALEVCNKGYCYRDGCPLACDLDDDSIEKCTSELSKASLDLINRQKAEIERLTLEYAGFQAGVRHFDDIGKTIRAEAIKEFAERTKAEISGHLLKGAHTWNTYHFNKYEAEIYGELIDNLVKEMMEGDE